MPRQCDYERVNFLTVGLHPELLVRPLHGEPFRVPLDKAVVSIGRSKRNHLVLADQWLSRHHAEIREANGTFYIHDLDSRNGTLVNGVRINKKAPLQDGDVVTLGDQTLTFIEEPSGNVVLSDSANPELDLEGTVVVPTEHLLAQARQQDDTWESIAKPQSSVDNSAAIIRQNQVLSAMSEASMALISDRPVNELLDFIPELAFKVVKPERGALMLITGKAGGLQVKSVRTNSDKRGSTAEEISFSRTIADKVIGEKVSILTSNAMTDSSVQFSGFDRVIRHSLCHVCAALEQQARHRPHLRRQADTGKNLLRRRPFITVVASQCRSHQARECHAPRADDREKTDGARAGDRG